MLLLVSKGFSPSLFQKLRNNSKTEAPRAYASRAHGHTPACHWLEKDRRMENVNQLTLGVENSNGFLVDSKKKRDIFLFFWPTCFLHAHVCCCGKVQKSQLKSQRGVPWSKYFSNLTTWEFGLEIPPSNDTPSAGNEGEK